MADPQAQDAHAAALEALAVLDDFAHPAGWNYRDAEYRDQYVEALASVRSRLVVLEQERAEAREALQRFVDAWFEWDANDADTEEPVNAAAGEAMCVLGTVISLAPVADIPQEDTP